MTERYWPRSALVGASCTERMCAIATVTKLRPEDRLAGRNESIQQASGAIDSSLHALPRWFAWFQKTFGLSFIVLCSAYLMGNLATLGWVEDIYNPNSWGWLRGVGVVFFFLGGVAISGIALTCSIAFVRSVSVKPRQPIIGLFTLCGMFIFFGIEVWASLAERSFYLVASPVDLTVLHALGFQGQPPISPTVLMVSLMFPLGSLFFGFVQQGREHEDAATLNDDAIRQERELREAEHKAKLASVRGKGLANRVRGLAKAAKVGVSELTNEEESADPS